MKLAFRVSRFGTKFIEGLGGGRSVDGATVSRDTLGQRRRRRARRPSWSFDRFFSLIYSFFFLFTYFSKELNVSSIGISLRFLQLFSFALIHVAVSPSPSLYI